VWGDRVEYPFSKGRLFVMTAIGLVLPLTVWGSVHYARAGNTADAVILAVGSVPLFLLDLWVWRRLLTNRPALVFLPDALIEQASLFPAGRLARSEIAGVRVAQNGFWRMVYLDLHQPTRRRMTPAIPAVLLGFSAESLAEEIRGWLTSGQRY
jgi:hypothetical protein